jgi:hypothetical protein
VGRPFELELRIRKFTGTAVPHSYSENIGWVVGSKAKPPTGCTTGKDIAYDHLANPGIEKLGFRMGQPRHILGRPFVSWPTITEFMGTAMFLLAKVWLAEQGYYKLHQAGKTSPMTSTGIQALKSLDFE